MHKCKQFNEWTGVKDNNAVFKCVECGATWDKIYTGVLGSHKLVNGRLVETSMLDRPYKLEKRICSDE